MKTLKPKWRKLWTLLGGAMVVVAAQSALAGHFLINFTPSIARGVYWISRGARLGRGDLVAFPIPERVRELVYERGYIPRSIRLLAKPIVAVGGDRVCVRDGGLFINDERLGDMLDVDTEGRPMPRYSGCGVLGPEEVFAAVEHGRSFDSRYFGPIALEVVRGKLIPLLTF
jgi:conjugative transfer signal peptidase TraF